MNKLKNLQQWLLYTTLGQYILKNEKIFYHNIVSNTFGHIAIQLGFEEINFLQGNKIPKNYFIGKDIQCNLNTIPFETNSVDLIVCPHIIECLDNNHELLTECYRILKPHGIIIITCFNKYSFFNLLKFTQKNLKQLNMVNLNSLKQQLINLNFHIQFGKYISYTFPINNINILHKLQFLDKIGNRWFPTLSNILALVASKEMLNITLQDNHLNTNKLSANLIAKVNNNFYKDYK